MEYFFAEYKTVHLDTGSILRAQGISRVTGLTWLYYFLVILSVSNDTHLLFTKGLGNGVRR